MSTRHKYCDEASLKAITTNEFLRPSVAICLELLLHSYRHTLRLLHFQNDIEKFSLSHRVCHEFKITKRDKSF